MSRMAEGFFEQGMEILKILNGASGDQGAKPHNTRIPAFPDVACTLVTDDALLDDLQECVSLGFKKGKAQESQIPFSFTLFSN